jgi:hypothetical protein
VGGVQRVDLAADQEQLAVADHHIAVGQLHLALAQGLDLPAFQHHAGLEAFLEEIVVRGLLVVGDAGGIGFLQQIVQGKILRYNPRESCIL